MNTKLFVVGAIAAALAVSTAMAQKLRVKACLLNSRAHLSDTFEADRSMGI